MRALSTFLSVYALAAASVLLLMPAMSNGGVLDGHEFFGLFVIGLVCVAVLGWVAWPRHAQSIATWSASILVGLTAPFVVLIAPLAYCVLFQQGKSCM